MEANARQRGQGDVRKCSQSKSGDGGDKVATEIDKVATVQTLEKKCFLLGLTRGGQDPTHGGFDTWQE